MQNNKILVVIDPTIDQQPAFERGLETARETGSILHLYACVHEGAGYANPEEAQEKLQPILDELVERTRKEGCEITSELEWDPDWARQVGVAAARCNASTIFKNSYDHSAVERQVQATADWTLLRVAPCPVLMVKNFSKWKRRRVLAAINPAAPGAAHRKLDQQITRAALRLADSYCSKAHFVVSFHNPNHKPDSDQIARECNVPQEQVHIRQGKAAEVIRDVGKELEVDLIIIGTVQRDGIKGRVIGNTSERLLDLTHSDVLILN